MASTISKKTLLKKLDSYVGSFLEEDLRTSNKGKANRNKRKFTKELRRIDDKYSMEDDKKELTKKKKVINCDRVTSIEHVAPQLDKPKGDDRYVHMVRNFLDVEDELHDCNLHTCMNTKTRPVSANEYHCDSNLNTNSSTVEVVLFDERSLTGRNIADESEETTSKTPSIAESRFNMKKARYDVQKFGITGFVKKDKKYAEKVHAIKLGARLPRKCNVPYKAYMEQKRAKKELEEKQRQSDKRMGLKVKSAKNLQPKRSKNKLGFIDGQVGRYRSGVQVLKQEHIEKIRRTRVKKV